jgi:MFS-type transporter involved in bile tolerance (Atg22 family)
VVFAAIEGTERAFVSDLAVSSSQATALGTFHTVTGVAALPASFMAGFLWEYLSPAAVFVFGSSMALIAVAVFLIFRKNFTGYGYKLS